jgi:serine/threonine protein kinase
VSYYGTAGFETAPFSHHLTQIINEKGAGTFKTLTDASIRELTLVPAMLKKAVSYDSLEFGDFEVLKFLGSGGFSQVFLGKCKLDYQYCALKFIRKDTITTVKKAKMLENEKNILFTIKHDNLIDLLYAF